MDRWEGKTAVLTGASSGIGLAVLKDLVKNGINVVAVARKLEGLQALKNELSDCRGKLTPLRVDLNNEAEIANAFKFIEEKVGPVHILINNAAVATNRDALDFEMEEWKEQFRVNVFAPVFCIQHTIRSIEKNNVKEAQIINISSIVAHRYVDVPGLCVYTATKTAFKAITFGLTKEMIKKNPNIKISSVSPGYVKSTDLFRQQHENYPELARKRDEIFFGLMPSDISTAVLNILNHQPSARVDDIIMQNHNALL